MHSQTNDLNKTPKRVALPAWGMVVFEARHAPGFFGEMTDPYAKFHLLIAGQALWESNAVEYTVSKDTLFHIAARVPHRQRDLPGTPVALYAIHYRPELLREDIRRALAATDMLPINFRDAGLDQARRVRAIVQEMLFEQETQRQGHEALMIARLTELAVLALRWRRGVEPAVERSSESAARVASYAARLKTEFYTAASLDAAARAVGLGRRRFTELFREVTGESWRQHVNRLRLDYAAKLLSSTERSVTAIAFESGFEELSHFHHSFKAAFGTSPMLYRTHHRPNPH
jgi:AraC-like DNA-binding protein